jgi:hypothetical protein
MERELQQTLLADIPPTQTAQAHSSSRFASAGLPLPPACGKEQYTGCQQQQ